MRIYANRDEASPILKRGGFGDPELTETVREIVSSVRSGGDAALFSYCEKFDGTVLTAETVAVSGEEIRAAYAETDPALLSSIRKAVKNVLEYHSRSLPKEDIRTVNGRTTGYTVRPVGRAGIYVPGGTAPLFSSVLMGVLPARAAGVGRIYVCTPAKGGKIAAPVLVACAECGVDAVFKIGGAQAVAALAYGTESIPKVDVIAGPGNIYVTLAKKEVYGEVGIDMLAGPSEIVILSDGKQNPEYIAADVLSQAEHDRRARAILVTPDAAFAAKVSDAVDCRLALLPRREIASYSVENSGGIILVKDMDEAADLVNDIAPEHLEIACADSAEMLGKIRCAGAVFLGEYTPEPVGDYFAGPDHVLPTGGSARYFQVLNADIFLRKMSVIRYTREALLEDAEDIIRLAENEGLRAHANAVRARKEENE